jgi:hypothetical protein
MSSTARGSSLRTTRASMRSTSQPRRRRLRSRRASAVRR